MVDILSMSVTDLALQIIGRGGGVGGLTTGTVMTVVAVPSRTPPVVFARV